MEGNLGSNDYGDGRAGGCQRRSFFGIIWGHLTMLGLHIETMKTNQFAGVRVTKQFWFPTEDLTAENELMLPLPPLR